MYTTTEHRDIDSTIISGIKEFQLKGENDDFKKQTTEKKKQQHD